MESNSLGSDKIWPEYERYRLHVNWDKSHCISEAEFPCLENANKTIYLAGMLERLNKIRSLKLLVPSRILINELGYDKNI